MQKVVIGPSDLPRDRNFLPKRKEDPRTRKILAPTFARKILVLGTKKKKKNMAAAGRSAAQGRLLPFFPFHLVTTSADISACKANETFFRLLGSS